MIYNKEYLLCIADNNIITYSNSLVRFLENEANGLWCIQNIKKYDEIMKSRIFFDLSQRFSVYNLNLTLYATDSIPLSDL